MSIEATAAGSNEPRREKASLFSIYKTGQGYWTRLGSAIGAAAVILFIASFAYRQLAIFATFKSPTYRFIASGVLVVGLALLTHWVMNAPKRAQFLIDTDSEMKKVNWGGGWHELVGATRVCIFFMLLVALTLFVFDTQFHAFFYGLRVWHITFPAAAGMITGFLLAAVLLAIGVGLLRGRDDARARRSGAIVTAIGAAVAVAWTVFLFRH